MAIHMVKKANGNTYGTAGGNKFTNVEKRGDQIILTSKYDAEEHTVPVLKKLEDNGTWNSDWGRTAMSSIPHISTLECYACHATWAPQCYGCHAKQDASKPNHDWLDDDNSADSWEESRSYLRWENPILGINTEGKVAPYIPGCQVIYTFINEDGEVIELNKIYTTKDGTSGIAHNPIQPHTISTEPRTCEECHTVQKTLGLGTGIYDSSENGLEIDFELERIVDESGNQIQATSHDGARPFNKAEQKKISRVGTCLGCHQSYSDPIWDNITDEVGFAENPEAHKSVLNLVLTSFGDQEPIFVFLATDGHDSKVYLKWNISTPAEVDHYEIYWSTTKFTNVSSLQANATTQNNNYIVEGLIPDSNYYFAIVALDSGGERTGVAFSKAKPTEEQEEDHDEDEDSHEGLEENVNILIMLIIILIIIILIIIAVCIRSKKSSQSEKEKVEKERPEEEDTDSE
jgi:hypothetical protein